MSFTRYLFVNVYKKPPTPPISAPDSSPSTLGRPTGVPFAVAPHCRLPSHAPPRPSEREVVADELLMALRRTLGLDAAVRQAALEKEQQLLEEQLQICLK